ncbi:OLC1v1029150C1 [Oldenlandia corymbosa var. corymbosa]|uniref:OLC1v1029150C1 n=1 Tax=Oldenlandia corymbosa var. corymbosa TaxID=529605 RepID=A0AAV1CDP2_OLDCO|nr:OLC1v1029150C1 [Oldenlandia corymbosa var. corymbosa]
MMIGDSPRSYPTVQVPPWDFLDDHPTANLHSTFSVSPNGGNNACGYDLHLDNLTALHRYLPSNADPESDDDWDDLDIPVDAFSCDEFRMFEFKVKKCSRARSHDWTDCPYAHPGEKARRRDPRKFHYSGSSCPEFKKGACRKGDSCEFAHGVFETWLHPARYRTQPCKDGTQCRRRVCFFAHTPDQLRVIPQSESYDGSPARLWCNSPGRGGFDSGLAVKGGTFGLSPTSVLHSPPSSPPADSPPLSPGEAPSLNSVSGLTLSMRNLQIANMRMCMGSPRGGVQMGSGFCSPRSPFNRQPGFMSLPVTPTRIPLRSGSGAFDLWEKGFDEEEPVMERVESGRDLRAKMYAKLSKENSLDSASRVPDFDWISELVK